MYDCLKKNAPDGKKSWTKLETSIITECRCFNCNRLLFTGRIERGEVRIKCGKCGTLITIGVNNATLATNKTGLKLVKN